MKLAINTVINIATTGMTMRWARTLNVLPS